jgi:hypothetical protein
MKKFDKFNEEIDVRGNLGIPGQPSRKPGEPDYLSDVTARAKQRLGVRGGNPMQYVGELMQNLQVSQQLSRGHERELAELATQVITDLYKPIIDHYKIKLDIQFSTGRDIRQMIDAGYARTEHKKKGAELTPVVRARGVDFSMLIHEAVKGIWTVISMGAVPKGELGKAIERSFDLSDEPEEWMYGPEIAADLRDFVNESPLVDKYPNLREELWKHMVDVETMPTQEFLDLMRGILAKTPEARKKVDKLLEEVSKKLDKRAQIDADLRRYEIEMEKYKRDLAEWEKKYGHLEQTPAPAAAKDSGPDYSKMSDKELQSLLDKALDEGDYDLASTIASFMK